MFLAQNGDEIPLAVINAEVLFYSLDNKQYNKISELEEQEFKPTGNIPDIEDK